MGIYGFRIGVGRLCRKEGTRQRGFWMGVCSLVTAFTPGQFLFCDGASRMEVAKEFLPELGVRLPAFHSHNAAGIVIEQLLPDGIRHDWWMMVVSVLVLAGGGGLRPRMLKMRVSRREVLPASFMALWACRTKLRPMDFGSKGCRCRSVDLESFSAHLGT